MEAVRELRERLDHWLYVKPGEDMARRGQADLDEFMRDLFPGSTLFWGVVSLVLGGGATVGLFLDDGASKGLLALFVPLAVGGLLLLDQARYERKIGRRV